VCLAGKKSLNDSSWISKKSGVMIFPLAEEKLILSTPLVVDVVLLIKLLRKG
jgi:hypothetical protein